MRHIHDQQVLHVGGAQLSACETISQIGGVAHLFRRDSPAQHRRSDVAIARLFLSLDSDVVAVDISRRMFARRWIEMESNSLLQFLLEIVSRPAVLKKQELEPRPLTMLPQLARLAKKFSDAFDNRLDLIPSNKCIQAGREMRLGRESAANPKRKASFSRT